MQVGEPVCVEGHGRHVERVAGRDRVQGYACRTEPLPQPSHRGVQGGPWVLGLLLVPQQVEKASDGDRSATTEQQRRQKTPLGPGRDEHLGAVHHHLDGAEDAVVRSGDR